MPLWIKICGNTTLADAQLAADLGADAVGFVFAPSPRQVTPAQAAAIAPLLPTTLEKIGVFVDASFDEIAQTIQTASLTGVQLHFNAPPELSAQLRIRFGAGLRILRVLHFDPAPSAIENPTRGKLKGTGFSPYIDSHIEEGTLAPDSLLTDPNTDAILVDSRTPTKVGGTGKAFDWNLAADTLFQKVKERKLIAAGGLTPDNVTGAISILRPWGVDVVSGVESSPGRKDPAKLRAFIANARAGAVATGL